MEPILYAFEIKLRYLGSDHYFIAVAEDDQQAIAKSRAAAQQTTGLSSHFELIEMTRRSAKVVL